MKRRCAFLDTLPAFNYNNGRGEYYRDKTGEKSHTDTRKLGSTLMETMLSEVAAFCDPCSFAQEDTRPHHQVGSYNQLYVFTALLYYCNYFFYNSWYMTLRMVEPALD